jgi:hypothetical protein
LTPVATYSGIRERLSDLTYEKAARNFLAMIHIACAMVWLR